MSDDEQDLVRYAYRKGVEDGTYETKESMRFDFALGMVAGALSLLTAACILHMLGMLNFTSP
jgi:hypothetical protein